MVAVVVVTASGSSSRKTRTGGVRVAIETLPSLQENCLTRIRTTDYAYYDLLLIITDYYHGVCKAKRLPV